eukprot:2921080-Rhodomonas_salina.1
MRKLAVDCAVLRHSPPPLAANAVCCSELDVHDPEMCARVVACVRRLVQLTLHVCCCRSQLVQLSQQIPEALML